MSTTPAPPSDGTAASATTVALRQVADLSSVDASATGRRTGGPAPSRATYRRRRVVVVTALLLFVLLVGVVLGRVTAQAQLEAPIAGQHVVEPGQTLWEVAVDTAPNGVDPRRQLHELRELNDVNGGQVEAWTVLQVPAW